MEAIKIIKATRADTDRLQKIATQTFLETYAAVNTKENMEKYLGEKFSRKNLEDELSDKNAAFYFAESGEDIVGYMKLNVGRSQTEFRDDHSLEIERIYVVKACHGKAVGQMLCETAMQSATQLKADYVWLGVWEENQRAMNFYRKNSFVAFDKHIFRLGDDQQTDILMKRALK